MSGPAAPVALLNVVALDFGRRRVGAVAPAQAVRVVNLGPAFLRVGRVTVTGSGRGDFTVRGSCLRRTIRPDEGCAIMVRFNPRTGGARHARLVISDNTAGKSHTIVLGGHGR